MQIAILLILRREKPPLIPFLDARRVTIFLQIIASSYCGRGSVPECTTTTYDALLPQARRRRLSHVKIL